MDPVKESLDDDGVLCWSFEVVMKVTGKIQTGSNQFTIRMTKYAAIFDDVTGQKLYAGTLNVKLEKPLSVCEHFRIVGRMIGEPEQDLLFENCRVNGHRAYRIRPYNLCDGSGGHSDDVIEIASEVHFRGLGLKDGDEVDIEFFR